MDQGNVFTKWFGRNWPMLISAGVIVVAIGVLWIRSNEFDSPPRMETRVAVPVEVVVVPGRVTIIAPGQDVVGTRQLVSNSFEVD